MERRTEREEGLDRGGHISPPPSAFSGGCGNHNHPYHSQTDTDTTGVLVVRIEFESGQERVGGGQDAGGIFRFERGRVRFDEIHR